MRAMTNYLLDVLIHFAEFFLHSAVIQAGWNYALVPLGLKSIEYEQACVILALYLVIALRPHLKLTIVPHRTPSPPVRLVPKATKFNTTQ